MDLEKQNNLKILLKEINQISNNITHFEFKKSQTMREIIQDPYQYGINEFIKYLKKDGINYSVVEKISKFTKPSELEWDILNNKKYDEEAKKIINQIKLGKISINNLTIKQKKYLVNFLDFPIISSNIYISFLSILKEKTISTNKFILLLTGYYKNYSKFIQNDELMSVFKNFWDYFFSTKKKFLYESIKQIQNKKNHILSKELPKYIANYCIINRIKNNIEFKETIQKEYPYIPTESELFNLVIEQLGLICYENIYDNKYQDILIYDILGSNIIPKVYLDNIVSNVINIFKNNIDDETKQKIKKVIINNSDYGDPRLNQIQWANIDRNAKQIFITWLAKDDLEFFFEHIFKNKLDPQNRKDFWLRYINSKSLESSKVILSSLDFYKWSNFSKEMTEGRSIGKFKYSNDDASCFVLEFKNVVIVEFSVESNALYLYDKEAFNIALSNKIFVKEEFKKSNTKQISKKDLFVVDSYGNILGYKKDIPSLKYSKVRSIYHRQDWEYLAETFLNYNGIYPGE